MGSTRLLFLFQRHLLTAFRSRYQQKSATLCFIFKLLIAFLSLNQVHRPDSEGKHDLMKHAERSIVAIHPCAEPGNA
jgi:hypothetical protein